MPEGRPDVPTYPQPAHLASIFSAPALLLASERLLIYSLVLGLRPERCLEIGMHLGGSAAIICAALDDVGTGLLVSVDPYPDVDAETWGRLKHRVQLVRGRSPDVLRQALAASSGKFDFVFIDGDHSYFGVLTDIEGVLPCLADPAYLLFHDSHYFEVMGGVDEALRRYPQQLYDCGMVATEMAPEDREVDGRRIVWGGLRLLLHAPRSETSPLSYNATPALERELRSTQKRLQALENSLTWRLSSRIAYSRAGRLLSYFLRTIAPSTAPGRNQMKPRAYGLEPGHPTPGGPPFSHFLKSLD